MMVMSVLHVTVLASINTGFHSDTIDATCWVFFCTYKLDLLLRIRAGWCAFWNGKYFAARYFGLPTVQCATMCPALHL